MVEVWAPTLEDVARLIPTRTRDRATPGQDTMRGTFTATTTPTDGQAQEAIDAAVTDVIGSVAALGGIPALSVPRADLIQQAARAAAAWRAAADIDLAYPNRDADVRVYDQLNARAGTALATLTKALTDTQLGSVDPVPSWSAPFPPPWSDRDPDGRTRFPTVPNDPDWLFGFGVDVVGPV